LTDAVVAKLRPRSVKYIVYDRDIKWFCVQVMPSGFASYKLIFPFKGKTRWLAIGRCDVLACTEARRRAMAAATQVIDGRDPSRLHCATVVGARFSDVHARYVEEHAQKKLKRWQDGQYLIQRNVLPVIGDMPIKDIKRADVRALLQSMQDRPALANRIRAAMSAVFIWAVDLSLVESNPCGGITRFRTEARSRALTHDELRVLWPCLSPVLKMILLTAARPGEATAMRLEHVGADHWWRRPGKPEWERGWPGLKGNRDHDVWLSPAARELIGEGNAGYAFARAKHERRGFVGDMPFRYVSENPERLPRIMARLCKKLGIIPPARPHDLRRTAATLLGELGYDNPAIARILGHAGTRDVTGIYNRHDYRAENVAMWEALGDRIMTIVGDNVVALAVR
jgi:integrase